MDIPPSPAGMVEMVASIALRSRGAVRKGPKRRRAAREHVGGGFRKDKGSPGSETERPFVSHGHDFCDHRAKNKQWRREWNAGRLMNGAERKANLRRLEAAQRRGLASLRFVPRLSGRLDN
ncbi:hypothetical protein MRX96_002602 [Rhipicephalus microplus]